MPEGRSRAWLEVDLDVLENNVRAIMKNVSPLGVFAVIKANAYGMGAKAYARRLKKAGVMAFCTATLEEALDLKEFGLPVQILGPVTDDEREEAVHQGIITGIFDRESAEKISRESVRQNRISEVHFKIDTDMGRTGILEREAPKMIDTLRHLPGLDFKGIYTHFPEADGENPLCIMQAQRFLALLDKLAQFDILPEKRHIANSDAINSCPFACTPPLTHVRAGIGLHGGFTEAARKIGLKPVCTLKAQVLAVRNMPVGHTIGYNRTCRLEKPIKTAVIGAGYADGIPLALSNRGAVRIRGILCPVLGRVSMDCTTVSLENCRDFEVKPGEEAVFLDGETPATSIETWAQWKQTHPYDILCSFGNRIRRQYKGDEA